MAVRPRFTLHTAEGAVLYALGDLDDDHDRADFVEALLLMQGDPRVERILRASDGAVLAVRTVAEKRAIAAADVSEGRGWKFGTGKRARKVA